MLTNGLALLAIWSAYRLDLLPSLALGLPCLLFLWSVFIAFTLSRGAPRRPELTMAIKATLAIHAAGGP